MVAFQNRVNPAFVAGRQALLAGELGELKYIYARLSNTKFVPTRMLPWASRSSALWFLASHTLDMACWLLRDRPARVYAVSRSGVLREMGIDTQDFHVAIVEFAGGAVVTLENSWILPETEPNVFNLKMELLGSDGSLYINTSDHRMVEKYTGDAHSLPDTLGFTLDPASARISGFTLETIARFVDAVVDDAPVLATGAEGALVTRVLCAIEESARRGQPVELRLMADDRLLLGIDIGTSSSKGVLTDLRGRILAEHAVPHSFDMPRPGWAEQDADAVWWRDFCLIPRALIKKADVDANRIAGVAASAIAPTMLPLDRNFRPLRPAILYGIDTRAGAEIAELTAALGEEDIFARTGHLLSAQSVGPKALWYRKNQPALFKRTRKIVTATTYLVFKLTGNFALDNYVAPYFTPFFDVHELAWRKDWVEAVCPLEWMPETRWSSECAGTVTAKAAEATGLPRGTPVAVGTADALAEAVAAGAISAGDLMVMYGTTLFLIQTTAAYQAQRELWASAHLRPGAAILAAGMATSGALLAWFRDELAGDERFHAEATGEIAFALLAERAAKTPAGSAGLITLPYFSGERTPINDVHAKGPRLRLDAKPQPRPSLSQLPRGHRLWLCATTLRRWRRRTRCRGAWSLSAAERRTRFGCRSAATSLACRKTCRARRLAPLMVPLISRAWRPGSSAISRPCKKSG